MGDQGGDIFIGGIDSGETVGSGNYDFGFTGTGFATSLNLTTGASSVPEPSTVIPMSTMLFRVAMLSRKSRHLG